MKLIKFTITPEVSSLDTINIIKDSDGVIDYYKTIEQLAHLQGDLGFIFEEEYTRTESYDGLRLLLKYRLAYFLIKDVVLAPVFVKLKSKPEEFLANNPQFIILFTKNTYIVESEKKVSEQSYANLTKPELIHILNGLPLKDHDDEDPHSLANEWGPFRLELGVNRIIGQRIKILEKFRESQLVKRNYYWYLLSKSELGNSVTEILKTPVTGRYSNKDWRRFTESKTGLNILIIDDELDKGWEKILKEILSFTHCEFYQPDHDDNISFNIKKYLELKNWDLVICDLRLTQKDKSAGTTNDISSLDDLGGVKVINQIKKFNTSIPVIALTASNKAWTFKLLEHKYGIDGYWIKESPEKGVDDNYSLINAASLLEMIASILTHSKSIQFLWDFINDLESAKVNKEYQRKFFPIIKGNIEQQISFINSRIEAIITLLKKGYGYLAKEPNDYLKKEFLFDPYEMAFIYIWGCLNEALHLRFVNNIGKDSLFLKNNYQTDVYIKYINNYEYTPDYAKNILKYLKPRYLEIKKPYLNPVDLINKIIVIAEEKDGNEYNAIFEALNIKRNNLYFIHGDSVGKTPETTSIIPEDLPNLIKILRIILMLR